MKVRGIYGILGAMAIMLIARAGVAEEVYLTNGDRLTGTIVAEDDKGVTIKTDACGALVIERRFIARIEGEGAVQPASETTEAKTPAPPAQESDLWKRDLALGYNESRGNTVNQQLSLDFSGNRKTESDEFTLKANVFYQSVDRKMDAQRWGGMVRYAFSFGDALAWYYFVKAEADHDKFANIDYRVIPSTGIGYWFADTTDWKAMAEGAVGLEYTDFRDTTASSEEIVAIGRCFFERRLIGRSRISQEATVYPALSDAGEFRLRAETVFTNPIDENFALKVSFIDEYNSNPGGGAKKNDQRLTSSLVYSF